MATKAATGFRVAYIVFFMIAIFALISSIRIIPEAETVNVRDYMEEKGIETTSSISSSATTKVKYPGLLDFENVFQLGDYLLFALDMVILAGVVNGAIAAASVLGGSGVAPETLAADIQDAYLRVMPHSTITDKLQAEEEIAIDAIVFDLGNILGAIILLILLPAAFLAGAGFVRDGDTQLAMVSFVSFQLLLAVSQFVQMHNVYSRVNPVTGETVAISLGKENALLLALDLDTSGLLPLITSPIFYIGMILYLYLEVSFQTSYALNIIEPMSERENRIKRHLQRIQEFRPSGGEEGTTVKGMGSQSSKKFDILAASYMRELVERRVFKKGERTMDVKATLRLQGYINSLLVTDLELEDKLTARSSQPKASAIAMYIVPMMALRMVAVVIIAYVLMDPEGLLDALGIINSIPPLQISLELQQPEFRTVALLNVILLIVGLSVLLHYMIVSRGRVPEAVTVQKIDTMIDFDDSYGTETPLDEEEISDEEEMVEEE